MSWDLHNDKDTVTGKTGRGRVFQAEETACARWKEFGGFEKQQGGQCAWRRVWMRTEGRQEPEHQGSWSGFGLFSASVASL